VIPPSNGHGGNGHGNGHADFTKWPTRGAVAKTLGISPTSVRRLESGGKLKPWRDDSGIYRFDPQEISVLADSSDLPTPETANETEADKLDVTELKVVGKLLGLIHIPREKIDALLLNIIDRQERRIVMLEAKVAENWAAVEASKNQNHERELVGNILKAEDDLKNQVVGRIVANIDRLFQPKKHFLDALTDQQLEELAALPNYWREAQKTAIDKELKKRQEAKPKAEAKPAETTTPATSSSSSSSAPAQESPSSSSSSEPKKE
jgi:hypothetical protein